MSERRPRHRPRRLAAIALVATSAALAAALPQAAFGPDTAAVTDGPPSGSAATPAVLATASPGLRGTLVAEPFVAAAALLRDGDYPAAWQEVLAAANRDPIAATHQRLVLGMFAHAANDAERVLATLTTPAASDPRLEDWRLLLLADAAAQRERPDVATAAIDRLLTEHPQSPLRPRALLLGATIAHRTAAPERARGLVERARAENVTGPTAVELERLAWSLGGATLADPLAREAARRLLTGAPLDAVAKEIEGRLPRFGQTPQWSAILGADDLLRRAEAFLAAERHADARGTLAAVPETQRSLSWVLLEARALTALHQGGTALAVLAGVDSTDPREMSRLAWARAAACADLAVAVRGRTNLPAAGRLAKQREADDHLREVVALDADPELVVSSLRLLFANLADDNLFDPALAALRRLRALRPTDTSGARYLWEVGWKELGQGNHSGAIGNWTVLDELYPETTDAYRGRYWKARAFEQLGDRARAHELYRELLRATDTSDFYRRQAAARLGGSTDLNGDSAPEPWQIDPLYERAWLFEQLGLDALAARELELLDRRGRERDHATIEAFLLAHRGERVESIRTLRAAWPALATSAQAGVPLAVRAAYYPFEYGEVLARHAARTGLPVHLLAGVIRQESAFDPKARSRAGARGLMQVMPATGRELAKKLGIKYALAKLYEPDTSVTLGSTYLRQVLDGFDGNLELALAGYNGGPGRIRRLWTASGQRDLDLFLESLPIEESRTYVKRVLVLADSYRQLLAAQTEPATPAG